MSGTNKDEYDAEYNCTPTNESPDKTQLTNKMKSLIK